MANAHSALRLVDPDTGEVTDYGCSGCFKRDEEIAALKVEKRGWITRFYNLKREAEAEEGHELFPEAKRVFDHWKDLCKHRYHKPTRRGKCASCSNIQFTAERFKLIEPHLRDLGEELCMRAVEGGAYDPNTDTRRNGTTVRFNDWGLIFRNRDKVEDFANRAPYHLPDPVKVKTLANALMFLGWNEPNQAVAEAQRRLKAR